MELEYCVSSQGLSYVAVYIGGEVSSIGIPPLGYFEKNQPFVFLFHFGGYEICSMNWYAWNEKPDSLTYSDLITQYAPNMCKAVRKTYGNLIGPSNNLDFIGEKLDIVTELNIIKSLLDRIV